MKTFCTTLFIFSALFAVVFSLGFEAKGDGQEWDPMIEKCQKQEGASDDDIGTLRKMERAKTHPGKCVQKCMGEDMGFMANGVIYADMIIAWLEEHFGTNPFMDFMKKTIHDCVGDSDEDSCETASKFFNCCMAIAENAKTSVLQMFMP